MSDIKRHSFSQLAALKLSEKFPDVKFIKESDHIKAMEPFTKVSKGEKRKGNSIYFKSPHHATHPPAIADAICAATSGFITTIAEQAKDIEKYKKLANENGSALLEQMNIIADKDREIVQLKRGLKEAIAGWRNVNNLCGSELRDIEAIFELTK